MVLKLTAFKDSVVASVTYWSTYEEPLMSTLRFTETKPVCLYLDGFYRRSHATLWDNSDGVDRADILARRDRANTSVCNLTASLADINHTTENYTFEKPNSQNQHVDLHRQNSPTANKRLRRPSPLLTRILSTTPPPKFRWSSIGRVLSTYQLSQITISCIIFRFHGSEWLDEYCRKELRTVFYCRVLASLRSGLRKETRREQL